MTYDAAQTLALRAVAHIAAEPDTLDRFMALTGLAPDILRHRIAEPTVLAGVLDYMLADESLLIGFCAAENIAPASVPAARRALPGAESLS